MADNRFKEKSMEKTAVLAPSQRIYNYMIYDVQRNLAVSYRAKNKFYADSIQSIKGASDLDVQFLDGWEFNRNYNEEFFAALFPALNEMGARFTKSWLEYHNKSEQTDVTGKAE